MHFYQVYKYSSFPSRNTDKDKLIKTFEFLKDATTFSKDYNIQKDDNGKYIIPSKDGYYVEEVLNPTF